MLLKKLIKNLFVFSLVNEKSFSSCMEFRGLYSSLKPEEENFNSIKVKSEPVELFDENLKINQTVKVEIGNKEDSLKEEDSLNLEEENSLNLKEEDSLNLKEEDSLNLEEEDSLNLEEGGVNLEVGNTKTVNSFSPLNPFNLIGSVGNMAEEAVTNYITEKVRQGYNIIVEKTKNKVSKEIKTKEGVFCLSFCFVFLLLSIFFTYNVLSSIFSINDLSKELGEIKEICSRNQQELEGINRELKEIKDEIKDEIKEELVFSKESEIFLKANDVSLENKIQLGSDL